MNSSANFEAVEPCACCGERTAHLGVEQVSFMYGSGDEAIALAADMPVWTCSACGERYTGEEAEEAERNAICAYLNRLTPIQILQIRRDAGLTQAALADQLSVGRITVVRWESGQQLQSAAHDQMIRAWAAAQVLKRRSNSPVFRTDVSHRLSAACAFRLAA